MTDHPPPSAEDRHRQTGATPPAGRQRMGVRTLCLAILFHGEASGYEIKKQSVEGEFSYFVEASFGSIYPALARLEADGCVSVREEREGGKPPRKVYAITDTGREELTRALATDPEPDIFRSEFLLIAMRADLLTRRQLARAIDVRVAQLEEQLAHFDDIDGRHEEPGTRWITAYGRACIRASLDHVRAHRGALEALARADAAGAGDRHSRDHLPTSGGEPVADAAE